MDEQTHSSNHINLDFSVLLHNFVKAVQRFFWFALALTLIVTVYSYYKTNSSYTPLYSSEAVFSVHANYADMTDITSDNPYMDRSAAQSLSATFQYVISSEHARMLLVRELGRNVNGTITAVATAESALFTMRVVSNNAQDAYDILLVTIDVYPQVASSILGDTQINIINLPTEPPSAPINANDALSSALTAGVFAFLVALAGIFLLSMSRRTVHSAEDLRKLVNLKCLAYVPSVRLKKHSNVKNLHLLITNPRVSTVFNESVRALRIKIQKQMAQTNGQILLITSTLPNEGKTTIATNLALSLSAEGKRVILIDGDLRKQSLKGTLGIDAPSEGLVEVLSGSSKNFHLLNVPNSNLLLLSGDKTIDQPQPLLDTDRFRQVLDLLRTKLDFIIIDSPPAAFLGDAATIAKYADATLYVVRQDLANSAQIVDSIQALSTNDINLIGCVLNHTQAGTTRYGYGSKYAGNYGYAYGYKYSTSYYGSRNRYSDSQSAAGKLTKEISDTAEAAEAVSFDDIEP